ncbi:hypothetical protein FHX44_1183 [Pseudonocardia hierapolitana]|uniref:Uncharacterized protein n=1 Tax=Pseudonocardia hierapolitana TaxID=1128676 RepID=A0A561SH62_9PSEU|nr:hypothetical protein FHX44_1183 [Pseudonocardia hierapolitana]
MTTAIVVLLLVATVVALSIVRPGQPAEFPGASADRDQERQLADLRAIARHQPDHSTWKVASRAASASTSGATSRASGWNGSHRTSPSM